VTRRNSGKTPDKTWTTIGRLYDSGHKPTVGPVGLNSVLPESAGDPSHENNMEILGLCLSAQDQNYT